MATYVQYTYPNEILCIYNIYLYLIIPRGVEHSALIQIVHSFGEGPAGQVGRKTSNKCNLLQLIQPWSKQTEHDTIQIFHEVVS